MSGSSIIYCLSSDIYDFFIIIQGVQIRTWKPNKDTPVIYLIKQLNNIFKSQ